MAARLAAFSSLIAFSVISEKSGLPFSSLTPCSGGSSGWRESAASKRSAADWKRSCCWSGVQVWRMVSSSRSTPAKWIADAACCWLLRL